MTHFVQASIDKLSINFIGVSTDHSERERRDDIARAPRSGGPSSTACKEQEQLEVSQEILSLRTYVHHHNQVLSS